MKKRVLYLVALLAIIAAIIVPVVVSSHGNTGRTVKNPAKQTTASVTGSKAGQKVDLSTDFPDAEGQQLAADSDSSSVTTQKNPAGETSTAARGTAAAPAASKTNQSDQEQVGYQVGIAVVGSGGKVLYHPGYVLVRPNNKWGVTALGALDATGLPYTMKKLWPDFVDSICGEACKGVSGWMFMVNGEIPMHMADKHPVKTGDRVIWWYSESMDQAPPVWEKLQ